MTAMRPSDYPAGFQRRDRATHGVNWSAVVDIIHKARLPAPLRRVAIELAEHGRTLAFDSGTAGAAAVLAYAEHPSVDGKLAAVLRLIASYLVTGP
jgi:hypothetical protein